MATIIKCVLKSRPVHNSNSAAHRVEAGQTLHGSIVYDKSEDAYTITQTYVSFLDSPVLAIGPLVAIVNNHSRVSQTTCVITA